MSKQREREKIIINTPGTFRKKKLEYKIINFFLILLLVIPIYEGKRNFSFLSIPKIKYKKIGADLLAIGYVCIDIFQTV